MTPGAEGTSARRRRGGLFGRIFLTFVATALVSAVVAAVAGFSLAQRYSAAWVGEASEAIDAHAQALDGTVPTGPALEALARTLSEELDAVAGVYTRRGERIAGEGPPHLPVGARGHRRELRTGNPVVFRRGRFEPPGVMQALASPRSGRIGVVVAVTPRRGLRLLVPLLTLSLMVPALGIGAWVLSRSLTRRLARIEASADRIARGDLAHRIALDGDPLDPVARDELDQLGRAFNEMAEKVEALLQGQRTLLANVSHELRTPIARMKVLVEILQERVQLLAARGDDSRPVQRLDKGLADMSLDIVEIETLISDLLTSGRLELRHGAGGAVQTGPVDVPALLRRVAARADAQVRVDGELTLQADALLVERLLSNLLANARRACPDGTLTISARALDHEDPAQVELAVEDEGPGVRPEDREAIFEPFTRLDAARDRDRGGVGLGLYLCRQICRSHGGSIEVTDRRDGAAGARFVVRLPARAPSPAAKADA